MWKLLTHNWNLKLTALVLAIVLWSHVRGEINPLETDVFRVPLTVTLPREVLVTRGKVPSWVQITLRAPRQTLRELRDAEGSPASTLPNPLVPAAPVTLHNDDVSALLDFSAKSAPPLTGEVTVPIRAECHLPDTQVMRVDPGGVTLQLDRAAQSSRPVEPRVIANPDTVAKITSLSVTQVVLYGPAQILRRVVRVVAPLTSSAKLGSQEVTSLLRPMDARGREVTGLVSAPTSTRVRLVVSERISQKLLRVIPAMQTSPDGVSRGIKVLVVPDHVLVRGPHRALAEMQTVSVPIKVGELSSNGRHKENLLLPDKVSVVGGSGVVEVRMQLENRFKERVTASEPKTEVPLQEQARRDSGPNDEPLSPESGKSGLRLAPPPTAIAAASPSLPPPAAP